MSSSVSASGASQGPPAVEFSAQVKAPGRVARAWAKAKNFLTSASPAPLAPDRVSLGPVKRGDIFEAFDQIVKAKENQEPEELVEEMIQECGANLREKISHLTTFDDAIALVGDVQRYWSRAQGANHALSFRRQGSYLTESGIIECDDDLGLMIVYPRLLGEVFLKQSNPVLNLLAEKYLSQGEVQDPYLCLKEGFDVMRKLGIVFEKEGSKEFNAILASKIAYQFKLDIAQVESREEFIHAFDSFKDVSEKHPKSLVDSIKKAIREDYLNGSEPINALAHASFFVIQEQVLVSPEDMIYRLSKDLRSAGLLSDLSQTLLELKLEQKLSEYRADPKRIVACSNDTFVEFETRQADVINSLECLLAPEAKLKSDFNSAVDQFQREYPESTINRLIHFPGVDRKALSNTLELSPHLGIMVKQAAEIESKYTQFLEMIGSSGAASSPRPPEPVLSAGEQKSPRSEPAIEVHVEEVDADQVYIDDFLRRFDIADFDGKTLLLDEAKERFPKLDYTKLSSPATVEVLLVIEGKLKHREMLKLYLDPNPQVSADIVKANDEAVGRNTNAFDNLVKPAHILLEQYTGKEKFLRLLQYNLEWDVYHYWKEVQMRDLSKPAE